MNASPSRSRRTVRRIAPLLLSVLSVVPAAGQEPCGDSGESVEMRMLLEKTIFQVDVLTLSVRIRGPAADRLGELRRDGSSTQSVRDSVARIAAHAQCAGARLDFLRDVSLDRFFDAVRSGSRAALDAGFIEPGTFALVDRSLPEWYAFLEGRGIEEGDRMSYRIRGDTLQIRFRSDDGRVLLDRTDVGAERRRSVLGGYFAPGSDFREGLLRSFFRGGERPADEAGGAGREVRDGG